MPIALLLVGLTPAAGHAATDPCAAPVTSAVACENSKPGTPVTDWQVTGVGDASIQGYATAMSVTPGQQIKFKIKTPASSYHVDILRLGYYAGDGARKVAANILPSATLPQSQPSCLTNATTGLIDCGNWGVSASWTVPSTAVSGVYIAHLVRNDTGGDSQIPFVVRDDTSHSDMIVATSDATWEAYNAYGGNSLYGCTVACPPGNPSAYKAAYAVSYNRPFDGSFAVDGGQSYLWHTEYQMIRFLERNGFDVSYTSQVDVDRDGAPLKQHRMFLSSGHDEYWSGNMRSNVEAARDAGVNLAFFSGNEVFWKTRFAASGDGTNTAGRTLISYKDTHFDAATDPVAWTGTWRDPRYSAPGDGGRPENSLTGQLFVVNRGTSDIKVPNAYAKLRFWRNTAAANLGAGQTLTLSPGTGTLGYEWDIDADNGFRPAGLFRLSSTTVSGLETFTDYGTTVTAGTTNTHNLTLYRAPSGALVFGAGTVQWSWALDTTNAWGNTATTPSPNPPDANVQQATVNLFADMGVQPATLMPGLIATVPSADNLKPTSQVTSPAAGATLQNGSNLTVSGTAADSGGVVAGVEVSLDGGKRWHPATGTASWTYSGVVQGAASAKILSRAVDDSGNVETPGPGVTYTMNCPCSLWGVSTPQTVDAGDTSAVELGMKFKSDVFGTVNGVRFYKAAANTGTHTGSLWTLGGTRLATVTFAGETASGWQQANFSSPVAVTPDTTYVVSYFAPRGHYSATSSFFYQPQPLPTAGIGLDSPPLHALSANGGVANGVYDYTATGTFPTSAYRGDNYFVDVLFSPSTPPGSVGSVTATAGRGSAKVDWTAPTTGGPATSYTITPYLGTTAQTATSITGTPPATSATISGLTPGTSYTFTVQAINGAGNGPVSAASNAVTPAAPTAPDPPTSVTATPSNGAARVTWTAPASDGGGAMTGYTITPYIGTTAQATQSASGTSATVSGLTNGVAYTFKVTATNAYGTSASSAASNAVTPQSTIFDATAPAIADSGDATPVEVGMKFKSDLVGSVTGIRFYKAAANTGTHTGSLWTTGGTRLATATFTGESGSGWQQVSFSSPVEIQANTTYVVSYFAPNGHYSATNQGFSAGVDNAPLHALANATSANGVYNYGAGGFPSSSYQASNYWVDVVFARTTAPGGISGLTATAGRNSATVSWTAPSSGSAPTSYKVVPYLGATAQTATTITGTPPATTAAISGLSSGSSYTFTVQAINGAGSGPVSAASNAVTPTAPVAPGAPTGVSATPGSGLARVSWSVPSSDGGGPITGYTVTPYLGTIAQTPVQAAAGATSVTVSGLTNGTAYTFKAKATNAYGTSPDSAASAAVTPQMTIFDVATPATVDSGDTNAVELGVKFKSDVAGTVTGIRFYKAATNTGTHTGSLWSAGGTRLATVTFTNETPSGWQQATLSNPVAIAAATTYVVSYFAPNGHYSATSPGLTTAVDNPPLHALANSTSANGLYNYGAASAFPTSTYNASNYFVDLVFVDTKLPGAVSGVTATGGDAAATVSWTAPSTGDPATSYKVTPYRSGTAQPVVTVSGSPPATSTTIKGLTVGASYTFTVQAVNDAGDGPASAQSNAVTPTTVVVPGVPTGVSAAPTNGAAKVSWNAPAQDGGSAITGYTVTPYRGTTAQPAVAAGASATSVTVPGLTNDASYTFTVRAANAAGSGAESAASDPVVPQITLFDTATPAVIDAGDAGSVEIGVKFTSDVAGSITAIRFYKAAANTGTHVGSLWSAAGTRLATVTFTNETGSGWQQATLGTPLTVAAGTTYVASYFAPNGHYSNTSQAFTSPFDNPPLHAVADGASANGVYTYSGSSAFPTSSWLAGNYWVDVVFVPGT
jgi:predicted RNA-binding protein with TRAM domain